MDELTPIYRLEHFLDAIVNNTTPPDPIYRVEFFLAKIAGAAVETPDPQYRVEFYLAKLCGEDVEIPDPIFRVEFWLAKLCGIDVETPTPIFRIEFWLDEWAGGGGSDPLNTFTGAIVRFLAKKAKPIVKLEANFTPVQDLNGYDAPWPPGGGKNLIPTTLSLLKARNTGGTWADNVYTISNVTFTVNNDGTITVNGTSNAAIYFNFIKTDGSVPMSAGTYVLHKTESADINVSAAKDGSYWGSATTSDATLTLDADANVAFYSYIANGKTLTNFVLKPMFESGSTASAWQPYSNICPISGWTGATVYDTGTNIWDEEVEAGSIYTSNGSDNNSSSALSGTFRSKNYIPVKENTSYYFKPDSSSISGGVISRLFFYDKDKGFISSPGGSSSAREFTTPSGTYFVRFFVNEAIESAVGDGSINYPSTDHDYHAYSGDSVELTFGSTVYGGTASDNGDGSWTVVATHALWQKNTADMNNVDATPGWKKSGIRDLIGSGINQEFSSAMMSVGTSWSANTIGSNDIIFLRTARYNLTQPEWIALAVDVQILVPLATPITFTVTAQQIQTLVGNNTVWADTNGDLTVEVYGTPIT